MGSTRSSKTGTQVASRCRTRAACWAFIRDRFSFFIYGSYPVPERWRVDIFFVILTISIVWMMRLSLPRRDLGAIFAFIIAPIVSFYLLSGSTALGLPVVPDV